MIIFAAVYLIMGIALIASPDGMSKILGIVVGLIAMALGAFVMTEYFRYQRLSSILASELFSGAILILIGFICIIKSSELLAYAPIIFAVMIIASGVMKMQTAINTQVLGFDNWWIMVMLALVSVAATVLVIVRPALIDNRFMIFTGIFFIYEAASDAFSLYLGEKYYEALKADPELAKKGQVRAEEFAERAFFNSVKAEEEAEAAGAEGAEGTAGASAEGVPAEGDAEALQGEAALAAGAVAVGSAAALQGEGAPVDANGVPFQGEGAPVDANGVPFRSEGVPADGSAAPFQAEGAPADGSAAPIQGEDAPADENAEDSSTGAALAAGALAVGALAVGSAVASQDENTQADAGAEASQAEGAPESGSTTAFQAEAVPEQSVMAGAVGYAALDAVNTSDSQNAEPVYSSTYAEAPKSEYAYTDSAAAARSGDASASQYSSSNDSDTSAGQYSGSYGSNASGSQYSSHYGSNAHG